MLLSLTRLRGPTIIALCGAILLSSTYLRAEETVSAHRSNAQVAKAPDAGSFSLLQNEEEAAVSPEKKILAGALIGVGTLGVAGGIWLGSRNFGKNGSNPLGTGLGGIGLTVAGGISVIAGLMILFPEPVKDALCGALCGYQPSKGKSIYTPNISFAPTQGGVYTSVSWKL